MFSRHMESREQRKADSGPKWLYFLNDHKTQVNEKRAYWEILMINYVIYDLEDNIYMGFYVLIYVIGC